MKNNYEIWKSEKEYQRATCFMKYKDILLQLFKEKDYMEFCKILKDNKHREGFESAIVYFYVYMEDKNFVPEWFMKHYFKYMSDNPIEYYSDELCHYLLGGDNQSLFYENNDNEKEAFGKTKNQLVYSAWNESIELISKLIEANELSSDDKTLFENIILFLSKFSAVVTNLARKYFDKYPISSFESVRDKKLKLIELFSKKTEEMGTKAALFMAEWPDSNEKSCFAGRHFIVPEAKIEPVVLYNMADHEIKDDEKYFYKIYTSYHELGHINQVINLSKYSETDQERFEMEKYLITYDKDFYIKNHDNFLLEQDANSYALNEIIKNFKNNKVVMEICELKANKLKQVQENDKLFFEILTERYEKIKNSFLDENIENKHL